MNILTTMQTALREHQAGNLPEAEKLYRRVLSYEPNHPDALHLLGIVMQQSGRLNEAEKLIGQAIRLAPSTPEFHYNLGLVLKDQNRLDLATGAFRYAFSLNPTDPKIIRSLGSALQSVGLFDEAIPHLRQAIELSPRDAELTASLGSALGESGNYREGMDYCLKSLAIDPNCALAHMSLGILLLRNGNFTYGWPEYEHRWRVKNLVVGPVRIPLENWTGGDLTGKRILLHSEQGLGDSIHMIRYAPLVKAKGGKTIVFCQKELARLFTGASGIDEVVPWGAAPPPFEHHSPLLSLPHVFKTDLTNIPAGFPFLHADKNLAAKWRERIGDDQRLKIGLSWAGSQRHMKDRQRSIHLTQLSPLAAHRNARFFSLQKGPAAEQAKKPPFELTDWTAELSDFADTAALVENLDLIITIDSAPAHLAGAMGKMTWVLLPFVPDWRWMLERADSPWYPTLRLFRQNRADDWKSVIAQLTEAMGKL